MSPRWPQWAAIREELGWRKRSWGRLLLGQRAEPEEWQGLAAYRGLVHQAWLKRPLAPEIIADLWLEGHFQPSKNVPAFCNPLWREREGSSHHYGHDIQLKRHAGLPLVGRPLPFLLEHGLKVAQNAQFETPRGWAHGGYLCMGDLRAQWLRERYHCKARAIGPWIQYAECILDPSTLEELRQQLGKTLLVVLAHSWDRANRSMDLPACIDEVQKVAQIHQFSTVIWLRHWLDPTELPLPQKWLIACNGHRSNPWFLDSLRTLMELCDGLISNSFGTHIGYAASLDMELHWINNLAQQDLSRLPPAQAQREREEWDCRTRIGNEMSELLATHGHKCAENAALLKLLNPFWGFDQLKSRRELRHILRAG